MRPAANVDPLPMPAPRRAAARQLVIEGEVLRSSSPDRMAANGNRAADGRVRGPSPLGRAALRLLRGIGRARAAGRALAARLLAR